MDSIELSHEDRIDYAYILELDHSSIQPPRQNTPGEGIYLRLWQQYIQSNPKNLKEILINTMYSRVSQRQASVCASFMKFMGCNAGKSFTHYAESLRTKYDSSHDAYRHAWYEINRRIAGINSGVRTIEAMLSPEYHIKERDNFSIVTIVKWSLFNSITTEDYDTVECMVSWWGSQEAQEIRAKVTP